jgi:hypothetical protein
MSYPITRGYHLRRAQRFHVSLALVPTRRVSVDHVDAVNTSRRIRRSGHVFSRRVRPHVSTTFRCSEAISEGQCEGFRVPLAPPFDLLFPPLPKLVLLCRKKTPRPGRSVSVVMVGCQSPRLSGDCANAAFGGSGGSGAGSVMVATDWSRTVDAALGQTFAHLPPRRAPPLLEGAFSWGVRVLFGPGRFGRTRTSPWRR